MRNAGGGENEDDKDQLMKNRGRINKENRRIINAENRGRTNTENRILNINVHTRCSNLSTPRP